MYELTFSTGKKMGAGHKYCQPNCPTPPVTTPPPLTTKGVYSIF